MRVLRPEEEVELARRVHEGDEEAREKLVLSNLRFVVSVAKQYQNFGLPLTDLISEGNLGLLKAVELFDETKGFKFISYAVWWIRQTILQAIAENARVIRLSQNKLIAIQRINRCIMALEQEYHREPTVEEIAARMEVTEKEVKDGLSISPRTLSMDAPLSSDEEAGSLNDVYVPTDTGLQTPEEQLNQDSLREDLKRTFTILTEREAVVLTMFYGLEDEEPVSPDEIGKCLGLTSERVRQIKAKAIRKLRELKNNAWLKNYL
jgi:RNA polymerase primary sigma factor